MLGLDLPVLAENLADELLLASYNVHLGVIEKVVGVVVVDFNIANKHSELHVLVNWKLVIVRNPIGYVRVAAVVSVPVPAS